MSMSVGNNRTRTKTRNKTRDLDEAKADLLSARHLEIYQSTKAAEDLPASGQWYCVECSRWFESENTLSAHRQAKPHKRRVKELREEPYTQKEAEAAIGLRTDNGGPRRGNEEVKEVEMTT